MTKILIIFSAAILLLAKISTAAPISGVKFIGGAGADYTTIQAAFTALNTDGVDGTVTLKIMSNYSAAESYPIRFGVIPGASAVNSVTLMPNDDIVTTINLSYTGPSNMIEFNGTDYVTIEGRPGGTGTAYKLQFSYLIPLSAQANLISMYDDACSNTIKYCRLYGSVSSTSLGLISIGNSSLATGNDDNTIYGNNINGYEFLGAGITSTQVAINLIGTAGKSNDRTIIKRNLIHDFTNYGVLQSATGAGDNTVLDSNSFYMSASSGIPASQSSTYYCISLNGGNGHSVTNNFLGGTGAEASGGNSNQTIAQPLIRGIYLNVGNTSTTNVQGNIIRKLTTSSQTVTSGGSNIAIEVAAGRVDIGTTSGNTISDNFISTRNGFIRGIFIISNDTIRIHNNTIASLTHTNTLATGGVCWGMYTAGTGFLSIQNNALSYIISSAKNTDANFPGCIGIINDNNHANVTITGNSFNYLGINNSPATNTWSTAIVMNPSGGTGKGTISKNLIFGFANSSTGTGNGNKAIYINAGSYNIVNNAVYIPVIYRNFINQYGICINAASGNTNNVFNNTIMISDSSTGAANCSAFLKSGAGRVNFYNNLIFTKRYSVSGNNFAMEVTDTNSFYSNYNFFSTENSSLVFKWLTTSYSLAGFKTASNKDTNSNYVQSSDIVLSNFISTSCLINNAYSYVWYVKGRGISNLTPAVTDDREGNSRSTSLASGPVDIGCDEITNSPAAPFSITASPAPVLNGTSFFNYLSSNVVSLNWGNSGTVPDSLSMQFYSGVTPPGAASFSTYKGYWHINAYGGDSYTYNLTLKYDENLLGEIPNESKLVPAKSENGVSYTPYQIQGTGAGQFAIDTNSNTITIYGLTSFSYFTLGNSDSPLPVELSSFTHTLNKRDVELKWATSFEINNAGFEVQRKKESGDFIKIAFVAGKGNSGTLNNYNYSDRFLESGKYYYRLKQIDLNGNYKYYDLNTFIEIGTPSKYNLSQNYPNPFNPLTRINYDLPAANFVSIKVYDARGCEVQTLVNQKQNSGSYYIDFNAASLSSGIYFYKIDAGDFKETKKMVLVK